MKQKLLCLLCLVLALLAFLPSCASSLAITEEKKESKKNTLIGFCSNCGYEIKVSRKMYEKHGQVMPTCICGSKMALDCEDGNKEDAES